MERALKKLLAIVFDSLCRHAFAQPDMAKYDKSCKVCHASGSRRRPKTGDATAWEPRTAKGMKRCWCR